MLGLGWVLFIVTVFAWDALKKSHRASRAPRVTLRVAPERTATCGCKCVGTHVVAACSAHALMLETEQKRY